MKSPLSLICALAGALAFSAHAQVPAPVGLWEFDDPADLGKATVGNDLQLNNANSTIAATTGISAGDGAANVGIGDSFSLAHDIDPNGGSTAYVNEFTIVYDIFLPASTDATWRTLLQTTTTPGGNDGDYFISTANRIGVAAIGYSTDTVAPEAWYRIVFSADIGDTTFGGGSFQTVVTDENGVSWTFNHASQGLDGRHSLYSTANSNIVHFFADNDGDDALVAVTNLALFDEPLSEFQALQLGTPGSTLQPAPPSQLSWTGEESSEWSTAVLPGAKNWSDGTNPADFSDFDEILFSDGAFTGIIDLSNGDVSPASITVDNASLAYIFDGANAIAGPGGLEKLGAGTLDLRTANTFSGPTTIGAGTILLRNSDALAGSAVQLDAAGGTLDFGTLTSVNLGSLSGDRDLVLQNDNSDALNLAVGANNQPASYSGSLSGSGSLTKQGTGTLILEASNSLTGGVTVESGALIAGAIDAFGGSPAVSTGGIFEFAIGQGVESTVANDFVLPTGSGLRRMFGSFGPGRTAPDPGTAIRLTGLISGGDPADNFRFGDTGISGEHDNTTILANPANSFSGLIQMWRSTLAFTSDGALGDPDNDIELNCGAFNGGLRFDDNILLNIGRTVTVVGSEKIDTNGFDGEIAGELAGSGSAVLRKIGEGILTITGTTGFGGNVEISDGALAVAGSADFAGVGNVAIQAGATLDLNSFEGDFFLPDISGNGSISGAFSAAGTVSPGTSIGTLTTESITFDLNVLDAEIDTSTGESDRVIVNGDLGIIPFSELQITDIATLPTELPPGTKLALIEYTGTWDGGTFDFDDGFSFVELQDGDSLAIGAQNFVIDYDDTTDGDKTGRFVTLTAQSGAGPFPELLYFEDFESATLIPAVDENSGTLEPVNGGFWNTLADSGLGLSNGGKDNFGTTSGRITEWTGFNLATHEFWNLVDPQSRDVPFDFANNPRNIIAIADSDEFNDAGSATEEDEFNVFLRTPPISLIGFDTTTLELRFDSSFRREQTETSTVNVYFDGQATPAASIPIADSGPNSVRLSFDAGTLGATGGEDSVIIEFAHEGGDNNWWWAIDNILLIGAPGDNPPNPADPYASWATTKITAINPLAPAGFDDDAEGDGVANGIEWVLGGDPLAQDAAALIESSTDAGLVLEFDRAEDSIGQVDLAVEWDTDLSNGFANSIPIVSDIAPSGDSPTVTIDTAPSPHRVIVVIPAANAPDGRLFARIVATQPGS